MASPNSYLNGIGGTVGARLATAPRVLASGNVWYVGNASGGSDAASPRGKDRVRPLATVSQAVTNAASGDIIVILAGHIETASGSALAISKTGLTFIGEGSGSSRPTFTLSGGGGVFSVSGNGNYFDNLYFAAGTSSAATWVMDINATSATINNCQFDCGQYNTYAGGVVDVEASANAFTMTNCTFTSVATAITSQPYAGLRFVGAISDVYLDTVTFDGGTVGWSNQFACIGAGAITRLRALDLKFINDSDMSLATGSTGWIADRNPSGSSRIVWAS